MATIRTRVVLAVASLAITAAWPIAPVSAQDIFDDLFGTSPKPKKQSDDDAPPSQGSVVPERVDRGALPDLAPAPGQDQGQGQDPYQPAPAAAARGGPPPGGAYDNSYGNNGASTRGSYDDRDTGQFDPIEARRSGYQTPARGSANAPPPQDGGDPGEYDRPPPQQGYRNEQPMPDGRAYDRAAARPDDRGGQAWREPPPAQYGPRASTSPQGPAERHSFNAPQPRPAGGLSYDPWTGITAAELEETLPRLDLPPRSSAIHDLWTRLITAEPGTGADPRLAAIRADALNRSGLTREAAGILSRGGDFSGDPMMATLAARTAIGAGNTEQGCETARSLTSSVAAKMPQHLKGEVILIAGFCAAASDNKAAAGIAADLAMENGLKDNAGPDALKAIAAGHKATVAPGKKVSLLDYRILQLSGPVDITHAIPTASPALLAVLARDRKADPASRLAAAEAAASLNAISMEELAETYRSSAGNGGGDTELSDAVQNEGQPSRRAALFVSAENERTPVRKARYIRAFLDEARRVQLYWPALQMMARPANELRPVPEIGWFAETAVEASLAAGDYNAMQRWTDFASSLPENRGGLRHWMALADIADPNPAQSRTQNLGAVEELVQHGRMDPALLHRLATVLDALDTNVPIPLWEAASRTEQPSTGHLPDTGVLSQLQDAGKQHDFARVVLLTMRTLGPNGAEGAHMIALGDSIRALKRAGLEPEARRLGLEALFASWPRAITD